jgi:hypothetical protein
MFFPHRFFLISHVFTAVAKPASRQLFASALRLLLGRLRYVEQVTQRSLLRCVCWRRHRGSTLEPDLVVDGQITLR